jgi:hypothetical protein
MSEIIMLAEAAYLITSVTLGAFLGYSFSDIDPVPSAVIWGVAGPVAIPMAIASALTIGPAIVMTISVEKIVGRFMSAI